MEFLVVVALEEDAWTKILHPSAAVLSCTIDSEITVVKWHLYTYWLWAVAVPKERFHSSWLWYWWVGVEVRFVIDFLVLFRCCIYKDL